LSSLGGPKLQYRLSQAQTLYRGKGDAVRHDLDFRWLVFTGVASFSGVMN
jgi:hypothetical protein